VIAPLTGGEIEAALPDLARLRIEVFRAFPYLYDGTIVYEAKYLAHFAEAKDALIVAARDGGRIIGCATGSALEGHHPEFAAPLAAAGVDAASTFYCGESVLLPDYRGRGVGHVFFDQREAHARRLGYRRSAFCAVSRPDAHPAKPVGYSPLDTFWAQRGYGKVPGAFAHFGWKDLGEPAETMKPMQVWLRDL
jgi:GNAT superfamily N-acetyltransferase